VIGAFVCCVTLFVLSNLVFGFPSGLLATPGGDFGRGGRVRVQKRPSRGAGKKVPAPGRNSGGSERDQVLEAVRCHFVWR
jgi:hypothetical protein